MFLEISCNRKISPPGLKRYPQNYSPPLVFSRHPTGSRQGLLGTRSLHRGTRHMAGHCTKMKERHGLLLGLGIPRNVSILTLVLLISPLYLLVKWQHRLSVIYDFFKKFKPLHGFISFVKMPFKKKTLIAQCKNLLLQNLFGMLHNFPVPKSGSYYW